MEERVRTPGREEMRLKRQAAEIEAEERKLKRDKAEIDDLERRKAAKEDQIRGKV